MIVEAAQTTRVPEVLWKGAAADDVLQGISSNDTLLFSVGDGHDTLNNFETIKLDGLHASDVQLERHGDDLVLRIVATGETATAIQEFKPSWWDSEAGGKPFVAPLQRITFGDGETWNLTPDAGGQLIVGHADYNNLQGTDGNDIIFSGAGEDDITGGKGDDVLRGGDGSDYRSGGNVTQNVTITVTGSNDAPVIAGGTTTASLLERTGVTGSAVLDTASGAIAFSDADLSDVHTAAVASVTSSGVSTGLPAAATLLAFLKAGAITEQTASTPGTAAWTFSAADSAFDYLAAGETVTLTYVVNVKDNHAGTTPQTVSVTITGTNDAPVIAAGTVATGAITERANLKGSILADSATGALRFADADRTDHHTVGVLGVTASGVTGGLPNSATLLSFLATAAIVEPTATVAGSAGWTFTAADKTFDYLSAGEKAVLTYAVQIADASGATTVQNITITVTGTNDAPVAVAHSGFTTDNQTALSVSSSSLLAGATDPDLSDVLRVASVQGAAGGTVALNANGDAIFTPTATLLGPASFTYTITDGHGGTSTAKVDLGVSLHHVNGTANADTLTGGTAPAYLAGLAGNDTLRAGSKGDTLDGGLGNDILYGGAGIDTFVFGAQNGMDIIYNFTTAGVRHDILQFDHTLFAAPANVLAAAHQVGADTVIGIDAQNSVTLKNTLVGNVTAADVRVV